MLLNLENKQKTSGFDSCCENEDVIVRHVISFVTSFLERRN